MEFEFRWPGEAESVRVRGSFGNHELEREGAAWRTVLDLPADVRASYWFALDGEDEWTRWLPDPANPKQYVYPAGLSFTGEHEVTASLLEGPAAPAYRWSAERDVAHGAVRLDVVDGRRVWRYVPPAAPEALLLLFDGHEYTTLAPIQNVLDNLLAEGLIPPTAAVLPDAPETEGRFRDLGMNRAFLDWCCETLLPWSGLVAPRDRTIVAGSSMGGLASLYFARERPDLFGAAIAQSGGFPDMPVVIPAGLPVRFALDVGVLEDDLIDSVRELRDDLLDKGYEPGYLEFPGGHDFFWWRETVAAGLLHAFRPGRAGR